jgi:hypothetical protein
MMDLGVKTRTEAIRVGALKLRSYQWDNSEKENFRGDSQTGEIHPNERDRSSKDDRTCQRGEY